MKMSLGLLAALVASTTVYAAGNTSNVWTGGTAGAYYQSLGPAIKTSIEEANKSILRKVTSFVKESAGSSENIDKVLATPDDYGIAQKDVIAIRTQGDDVLLNTLGLQKVDGRSLITVRDDAVSECLYLVVGKEFADQVDSFGQILTVADGLQIATGSAKSGSNATLAFIRSVIPEMKNVTIKNYDKASDAIQKVATGEETAAFFVQMPDPANPLFKMVSDNNLGIIGVAHEKMFDLTVQDLPVYEAQTTTVQDASWGSFIGRGKGVKTVETSCIPATIITSAQSNPKIIAKLKSYDVSKFRPQEDFFQKMINSSSKHANPSSLLEQVKNGVNKGISALKKN